MAKRPKYSRWRRLPKVYRSGELRLPDPRDEEQRLTLYLPGGLLDVAEEQAARSGSDSVQDYCAQLLSRALEVERVRGQVAEVEARRGPLEGLHAIANDLEYLAEWNARAVGSFPIPSFPSDPTGRDGHDQGDEEAGGELSVAGPLPEILTVYQREPIGSGPSLSAPDEGWPLILRSEVDSPPDVDSPRAATEVAVPDYLAKLSPAAEVVLRHAAPGVEDRAGFLAALRRGQAIEEPELAELTHALTTLEAEHRDAVAIDRRLAYALHRLAFEAQVLHTDAWTGAFDNWTVDAIRKIQEAVDRILSGQDIHYYPVDSPPESLL